MSERERLAEDAERDLTRYYHARWAKEHRGEVFNGLITGVTNFGIFVALPNGVEGLVHVSQLEDDYYMYIEDQMMMLGKSSKKKFRLGGRMEVRILNANPTIRQIDLGPSSAEVPDEPEEEERPTRACAASPQNAAERVGWCVVERRRARCQRPWPGASRGGAQRRPGRG